MRCPCCHRELQLVDGHLERAELTLKKLAEGMPEDLLELPVQALNVPARARYIFWNPYLGDGVRTIRELCELDEAELLQCGNFGKRTLEAIKQAVAELKAAYAEA